MAKSIRDVLARQADSKFEKHLGRATELAGSQGKASRGYQKARKKAGFYAKVANKLEGK